MFEGVNSFAASLAFKMVQKHRAPKMIGSSVGKNWLFAYFSSTKSTDKYMFEELNAHSVRCLTWKDDCYSVPETLELSDIDFSTIEFYQYFDRLGCRIIIGLWKFLIGRVFLFHIVSNFIERTVQWLFNARFRLRKDRVLVLREILSRSISSAAAERNSDPFSTKKTALDWFFDIHGVRSIQHPSYYKNVLEFKAVLLSLVASRDLICDDHKYSIAGVALMNLADFELEERKHKQQFWTNVAIAVFTAVSALAAF